jgi:bifunctional NMN adenylyltransferase/nudix hydrolase
MILSAYPEDIRGRILVTPLLDTPYSDPAWTRQVQASVQAVMRRYVLAEDPRVGLIGHTKDNSSYSLETFPEWPTENVGRAAEVDAANLRWSFLRTLAEGPSEAFTREAAELLPATTLAFLDRFAAEDIAAGDLADEWRMVDGDRRAWANAPFPPTFVTVDAVVVQAGHVLVIKRKFAPGRGQLALPGGFVEPHEWLDDAVVRELDEETQIDLSAAELKRQIKRRRVFDDPNRSDRGRTITHGFLIEIPGAERLTDVCASDDAEQAFWTPIADLDPQKMFEDHWDIVQELLREPAAQGDLQG